MSSSILKFVLLFIIPGGIGGFIFAMTKGGSYKLRLPFVNRMIELGFLGDLLYGVAGSSAAYTIGKYKFDLVLSETSRLEDLLGIAAMSMIAGFSSTQILPYIAERFAKSSSSSSAPLQVHDSAHSHLNKKLDLIIEEATLCEDIKPSLSAYLYKRALDIDNNDPRALRGLMRALEKSSKMQAEQDSNLDRGGNT
jgi:hypothetical protein